MGSRQPGGDRAVFPRRAAVPARVGKACLAGDRYDTAGRQQLAEALDGVADAETIRARVLADTMQGRPAAEVVTQPGRLAPATRPPVRASAGRRNPSRADRTSAAGRHVCGVRGLFLQVMGLLVRFALQFL